MANIKPFLTVNNGIKAVEFYIEAFGAVESQRFELENNKISSVIQIEDSEFYLSDEEACDGSQIINQTHNTLIRIILETKNADKIFENAVKFGATVICPIATEEDWRIGKLKDPFGHIWEIGYPL
ncbi:VOC family protein [Flavobacterium sp. KACC 22758]|jgi:PhnB protein|uniref:VOC family protein n=1 Tax=Flavobacterium sp. KACC 22758 TaxID=3025667 RepID=UPI002366104E|nr:VOC family protein [Flavobacterium sp. KACC 22758]WDF61728.1 VOC family protein [Flavobacterium sp. KACC 22758]